MCFLIIYYLLFVEGLLRAHLFKHPIARIDSIFVEGNFASVTALFLVKFDSCFKILPIVLSFILSLEGPLIGLAIIQLGIKLKLKRLKNRCFNRVRTFSD